MERPPPINVEAIGPLLRTAFREREKNVEKLHGVGGTMLAIFALPASKTPQIAGATWGEIASCRITLTRNAAGIRSS